MSVYADTHRDIAEGQAARTKAIAKARRRRDLVRRSDDLLDVVEGLNLRAYGALRLNGRRPPEHLEACRLTHDLVAAVNELLVEVGLSTRRLRDTAGALEAVFDCQSVIFHGHPNDEEEDSE